MSLSELPEDPFFEKSLQKIRFVFVKASVEKMKFMIFHLHFKDKFTDEATGYLMRPINGEFYKGGFKVSSNSEGESYVFHKYGEDKIQENFY